MDRTAVVDIWSLSPGIVRSRARRIVWRWLERIRCRAVERAQLAEIRKDYTVIKTPHGWSVDFTNGANQ